VTTMTRRVTAIRESTVLAGNKFFLAATLAMLAIVVIGFAPSILMLAFVPAVPVLPPYVHVHAAIVFGWFVLVVVQASLIVKGRVDLHRPLGIAGVALGVGVIVTSSMTTLNAFARVNAAANAQGVTMDAPLPMTIIGIDGSKAKTGLEFFSQVVWIDLAAIVSFATLFIAAIALRHRPDYHKRFMLIASISILGPAFARISRWPVFGAAENLLFLAIGTLFFLIAIALYDAKSIRRVHGATLIGAAACASMMATAAFVANSEWGQLIVRRMA
jgi:hypothetical protein